MITLSPASRRQETGDRRQEKLEATRVKVSPDRLP